MARITWLGEGASPPPALEWRGVTFPLGQAVEVDDPAIIAKAKTAASIFKVVEDTPASAGAGSPPKPKPPPEPEPEPEPQPGDNQPAPAEAGEDEDDDDEPPHPPPSRGQAHRRAVHATRKKK